MDFYTSVTKLGNILYIRGYKDGKRLTIKEHYEPILFFVDDSKEAIYRSIDNIRLKPFIVDSIKSAQKYLYEDYDSPVRQIYGQDNFPVSYICENWPDKIPYDRTLIRMGIIDIEVESDKGFPDPSIAKRKIVSITLKLRNKIYVWGLQPYDNDHKDVIYYEFTREKHMLEHFLEKWQKLDLDIITGWNIETFDIPYIVNRLKRLFSDNYANKLSPFNWIYEKIKKLKYEKVAQTYALCGIQCIDYLSLYQKLCLKNRESYKLDYIGYVEEVGQKLDYSEYASLAGLYKADHNKFIRYNIHDVELVERLDNKLRYMDVVLALAYTCHINYEDIFSQTRNWDALIYNHLIKKGIVFPPKQEKSKSEQFKGAVVKPPLEGMHEWVVGYDITSLYPSLILQYNISPDTIIEGEHEDFRVEDILNGHVKNTTDHIMTANGYFFKKNERGFLPEIIEDMFAQRQYHKKLMLEAERNKNDDLKVYHDSMQATYKVTLNSAYGTMGSPYFRFYDIRLAEAITISGQTSIRWAINKINAYLNKVCGTKDYDFVIASDTDSMYLTLEPLVKKFCDDPNDKSQVLDFIEAITSDRLQKVINKTFSELAVIMGCPKNRLSMKLETISDRGFWTTKKRYALNMLVSEAGRLSEPKIKITGLEAVRTTVPEISRNAIKKAIEIMLRGTNEQVLDHIEEIRNQFDTLPLEDIAKPTGVSNLEKFRLPDGKFKSGTPMHVRAALNYNDVITREKLNTKYELIKDGDHLKVLYLKKPNRFNQHVIGFTTVVPKEIELERFVDRDMMFDKMFFKPLQDLLGKARTEWDNRRRPFKLKVSKTSMKL